jgi:Na+/citrate or Na+/malate symporter
MVLKQKRLKVSLAVFAVMLIVGMVAWWHDAENMNALTGYMGVAVVPVLGFIFADTFRKSEP